MVSGDGVLIDVDVGGDVCVHRPREWIGQYAGGDAADLEARSQIRQHGFGVGRGVGDGDTERIGLAGDDPFGYQELGEPPTELTSFAGARPRQGGGLRRGSQHGLAGVDLVDGHRIPGHRRGEIHRTVTSTAGV